MATDPVPLGQKFAGLIRKDPRFAKGDVAARRKLPPVRVQVESQEDPQKNPFVLPKDRTWVCFVARPPPYWRIVRPAQNSLSIIMLVLHITRS